jgi:hypothetical protein
VSADIRQDFGVLRCVAGLIDVEHDFYASHLGAGATTIQRQIIREAGSAQFLIRGLQSARKPPSTADLEADAMPASVAALKVASSWIGQCAKTAKGQATSLYQIFFYLGASVAGTWGGMFWQHAHWLGVGLFIAGLLTVSLLISLKLAQEAASQS